MKYNMQAYRNSTRYKKAMEVRMKVLAELQSGKTKEDIEKDLGKKHGYVNSVLSILRKQNVPV